MLTAQGVSPEDAQNYAVAGCQEPLIAGKDNGNTTNSWLNLAKVLEVTLNGGCSAITGKKIASSPEELTGKEYSARELFLGIKEVYDKQLDRTIEMMTEAADRCSLALSRLRTPFLSCAMGGVETGVDLRDDKRQGTKYNGSGCLIHGLSVLADSFQSLADYAETRDEAECERLLKALRSDFEEEELLRQNLLCSPKFGNNVKSVDEEAARIVSMVSDRIAEKKNYLGNSFRPDWSSPSTHLLYGYWDRGHPGRTKGPDHAGIRGGSPLRRGHVGDELPAPLPQKALLRKDDRGMRLPSGVSIRPTFPNRRSRKREPPSGTKFWSPSLIWITGRGWSPSISM